MVTPYAGVWIEITIAAAVFGRIWSLPTRECGLKFIRNRQQHEPVLVTPYAGVWIEIIYAVGMTYSCVTSLPTRECGLKLLFASAERTFLRHSLRGSVDWNFCVFCYVFGCYSHSLRGSVDWNYCVIIMKKLLVSHSLRGSVDWNHQEEVQAEQQAGSLPTRECGLKFLLPLHFQ